MNENEIPWKDLNWEGPVREVISSLGSPRQSPPPPETRLRLVDDLCMRGSAMRDQLMEAHGLKPDGVATILAHVTMVVQHERGPVKSPQDGGWYLALDTPRRYVVAPRFAATWTTLRGLAKKSPRLPETSMADSRANGISGEADDGVVPGSVFDILVTELKRRSGNRCWTTRGTGHTAVNSRILAEKGDCIALGVLKSGEIWTEPIALGRDRAARLKQELDPLGIELDTNNKWTPWTTATGRFYLDPSNVGAVAAAATRALFPESAAAGG